MSLNPKMEDIVVVKNYLKNKLINEGLNKREKTLLDNITTQINEAPIDYSNVGGSRMERGTQSKIDDKQTPFHEMGLSDELIDVLSSEAFQHSVEKVKEVLGDNSRMVEGDPNSVFRNLMGTAMNSLGTISRFQNGKETEIENLAVKVVTNHFSLDKPPYNQRLKLRAELTTSPMSSVRGMRTQPEKFSDAQVIDAFKNAEKHQKDLEEFAADFEDFDWTKGKELFDKRMEEDALQTFKDEKIKRRIMNTFVQGAAFNVGHLYKELTAKINNINPELMTAYNVSQSTMEHLYWMYPNMEESASAGMGHLGQVEILDPETEGGPYIISAKAMTLPLLVHELVKGVFSFMAWDSLPEGEKQSSMVAGSEDTLPGEVWDSRLGLIFWKKLQQAMPNVIFEDNQRIIQLYLVHKFGNLPAKKLKTFTISVLEGHPSSIEAIDKMIEEIKVLLEKTKKYYAENPPKTSPSSNNDDDEEDEDDEDNNSGNEDFGDDDDDVW
jgi:hypothetical protein